MTPQKFLAVGGIVMALLTLGAVIENWRDHRRMTKEERRVANLWLLAVGVAFMAFLAFAAVAFARDLDGRYAQSPLKPWFDSLKSGKGPCCSKADGYVVEDADWETAPDGKHYRVRIPNKAIPGNPMEWVDVPDDAVITEPNLAGKTMVWPIYGYMGASVRCFIPGVMM